MALIFRRQTPFIPPPPTLPGLPPAPRFAFWSQTSTIYNTASTATRLARADLVSISTYEGIGAGACRGGKLANFISDIKSPGNGVGTPKVTLYHLPDTFATNPLTAPAYPQMKTVVEANNWDVYNLGTSGTKTPNYFNASWTMANSTTNVPASGGMQLEDTFAQFVYEYFILGTFGGPNQAGDGPCGADGGFHDNALLGVPTTADWLRTGIGTQSFGGSADTSYKNGQALNHTWFKTNAPGFIRNGNIANWGAAGHATQGSNSPGACDLLLNGGMIELLLGAQFGLEQFGTFADAQFQYQFCMAHTVANSVTGVKYVCPACYWDSSGKDYLTHNTAPWNSDPNFQASRSMLGFVCQDDGFASINAFPSGYNSSLITWIDEMTVNPLTFTATGEANSTIGKGYMGQAIDPAWTVIPGKGVYARRYQNSLGQIWVPLYNPKGNGAQTVVPSDIPGGFGHFQLISGTQAPTINSGALVTSIALSDRDARFVCMAA